MIKKCEICSHVGELTWRNGKYYCAMCGSEVAETDPVVTPQPQVQARPSMVAANVMCPICKNKENNQFDGIKYHCALCRTSFDLQQAAQLQQYDQYGSASNSYAQSEKQKELKKERDNKVVLGIVFVFLFWPVSIYFFYKAYQLNNELKYY